MENPIEKVDWVLLRKQKLMLLEMMNEFSLTYFNDAEKEGLAEGLINLIDSIQDYAIDELDKTEEEVFGKDFNNLDEDEE